MSREGCAGGTERPARRRPRFAPVVRADNEASRRYTILDIVASNALGLLHRISRVISQHGCEVDLVLIATEGEKPSMCFTSPRQRETYAGEQRR
jgi:[protein-PII] uridylyltransferase